MRIDSTLADTRVPSQTVTHSHHTLTSFSVIDENWKSRRDLHKEPCGISERKVCWTPDWIAYVCDVDAPRSHCLLNGVDIWKHFTALVLMPGDVKVRQKSASFLIIAFAKQLHRCINKSDKVKQNHCIYALCFPLCSACIVKLCHTSEFDLIPESSSSFKHMCCHECSRKMTCSTAH